MQDTITNLPNLMNIVCTSPLAYPCQVQVDFWRWCHGIISIDDGDNVQIEQLIECGAQILVTVIIVKVRLGHQDLKDNTW